MKKKYLVDVTNDYPSDNATSVVIGQYDTISMAREFIYEVFETLPQDNPIAVRFRVVNVKKNIVVYDYDGDDGNRDEFYGYPA